MGIQNAAAQRLAVPELTTTVLTRTLTGIASEGAAVVGGQGAQARAPGGGRGGDAARAVAGGLLALEVSVAAALGVACAIVVAVTLAVHMLLARRGRLDTSLSGGRAGAAQLASSSGTSWSISAGFRFAG